MEVLNLKKLEFPSATDTKMENEVAPATRPMLVMRHSTHMKNSGLCSPTTRAVLMRQSSNLKNNCLCSPTTHAGSFRCRLHRVPSLQRTKSMGTATFLDPPSKSTD
ncbi:hypothetical protein IFM89_009219 [Coptis chinensis]|uniref:Uncharacterized protein n=1 Tax=Coptis chinensis TaxID=261450 RepID=A0A835MHW0_9MAGN|nr:hypothetical protein IFM89_009219 [Coptis chinensis]